MISTMIREAEIRFLEFLCIADVEGPSAPRAGKSRFASEVEGQGKKKEEGRSKLLSTAMVSAIKNFLKVGRSCYRGSWVDEVNNHT